MQQISRIQIYVKLVLTAIFWGGTFIAGRVVSQQVSPFSAAFFRFIMASLCLLLVIRLKEGRLPIPAKQQLFPLFLLGLTGIFAYNYFFFKGLKLVEAGRASVIVAQNPIVIALLSAYFFKERLTPLRVAAILLSVSGAALAITRGNPASVFQGGIGVGELYIFGCVATWAAYSLLGKAVMRNLSPLHSVTHSVLIGTGLLLPFSLIEGGIQAAPSYDLRAWAGIAYLAVFGTVLGFFWFYEGIQQIGAMKAGLFINFVPISAIIMAVLLLGEPMTWSLLVGSVLVISGVVLMNWSSAADARLKT